MSITTYHIVFVSLQMVTSLQKTIQKVRVRKHRLRPTQKCQILCKELNVICMVFDWSIGLKQAILSYCSSPIFAPKKVF